MSQESLHQLRTWIAESGLDAFLVSQAQNRSYLSGWLSDDTESHSSLLIGQQEQLLLTNSLFAEVAEKGWASHRAVPGYGECVGRRDGLCRGRQRIGGQVDRSAGRTDGDPIQFGGRQKSYAAGARHGAQFAAEQHRQRYGKHRLPPRAVAHSGSYARAQHGAFAIRSHTERSVFSYMYSRRSRSANTSGSNYRIHSVTASIDNDSNSNR